MSTADPRQGTVWSHPGRGFWNYNFIEVLVFLFLIVPSMVLSLIIGGIGRLGFASLAVGVIVRDLALVSLVFYFIWRNGESRRQLGWTGKNAGRELALGVILFVPFTAGAYYLDNFLQGVGLSVPHTPLPAFLSVHGLPEIGLAFILVVIVALAEETIFRGYLLLRFQGARMRPLAAALLSALIFSLGHGYEGTAGVVTVGFMGLVFALLYLWRGSLVAPVIMHFLQDFFSIVMPPLLK